MLFSYRFRRFCGKMLRLLLVLLVLAVLALACWLLWLQRYVIYTADGVRLDFSLSAIAPGQIALPPQTTEKTEILYEKPKEDQKQDPATALLTGYYVEEEELYSDIPGLLARLKKLPAGTPVLLDVKNYRGYFYYSTSVGSATFGKVDVAAMDELLQWLGNSELYSIARLPALADYVYGAENPAAGLPVSSGALYFDEQKRYWLDPTKEDTLTYLIQTARELRSLGFDEVVFSDLRIPEAEKIVFAGDRQQAVSDAAQAIVSACATENFLVSFVAERADFPLPTDRSRLYLMNVAAADVAEQVALLPEGFKPGRLVFFADNTDNRYNAYGVLRPLSLAVVG